MIRRLVGFFFSLFCCCESIDIPEIHCHREISIDVKSFTLPIDRFNWTGLLKFFHNNFDFHSKNLSYFHGRISHRITLVELLNFNIDTLVIFVGWFQCKYIPVRFVEVKERIQVKMIFCLVVENSGETADIEIQQKKWCMWMCVCKLKEICKWNSSEQFEWNFMNIIGKYIHKMCVKLFRTHFFFNFNFKSKHWSEQMLCCVKKC